MPKITKEFNQAEYTKEYQRTHYSKLTAAFNKEEAAKVEEAASRLGMSKSAFIKLAVFEKLDREK